MMVIDNKYNLGEVVYLKTDTDQRARIITGVEVNARGLTYRLVCGTNESFHYEFELSEKEDTLIKVKG